MNKRKKILSYLWIVFFAVIFQSCSNYSMKKEATDTFVENSTKIENDNSESEIEIEFQNQLSQAEENLKKHVENVLKNNNPDEIKFYASDLYLKATDSSIRGDSQIAALLYKYVIKLNSDNYILKKYAIELIRTGELTESLSILEKIYKENKEDNIGLVIAGVHVATGKKQEARSVYGDILKRNPKNVEACIFLAKSHLTDNEYEKVDGILNQCKKNITTDASFSFYQGKIALTRNQREKAIGYFEQALKIDKKYYQAAVALGIMYEEKEKYKEARSVYENFLNHDPDNFEVLSRLVQILFLKEKSDKIIPYMERMTYLDSTDLNSKVRLGVLYTDVKNYAKAKGIFKEILVAVPDSDKVLFYLGSLSQELGDYDDAIAYYNKISPESELFRSANVEIAKMLYAFAIPDNKNEDKEKAVERFIAFVKDTSLKYPSLKVDLYFNLASYYEGRMDYSKAIDTMSEVKSMKEYLHDHDYYLASLMEKRGDYKQSREIIHKIIENDPSNAHALNFLGYSYLENEIDLKQAYSYINRAINLKPDDGYIRDSLGWYYYKSGELDRALIELKKAWMKENKDSVINQHLAIVYQKLKYYDKAKKFFVEALKHCKENQELKNQIVQALEDLERIRIPASQ